MKTVRATMALLAGSSLLLVGCAAPPEAPAVDIAAEKAAVEQVVQDQLAGSGDVAYAVGEYEISWKDADGNPVSDKGKWMNGFQKQADGSWKISAGTFNSDLPVATTPAASE